MHSVFSINDKSISSAPFYRPARCGYLHHRLNVAKLDHDILSEKMNDTKFQLTIMDLALLEKIKSIDKRNEILEEAEDSRDIVWLVERAALKEKRERAAKNIHKAYFSVTDAGVDAMTDQIDDMPAYTHMLAVICQNFDGCDLMNYNAEYRPEKASLLHDFHYLLVELDFSFSDEAFYEVMTGTHFVYRRNEEESSNSDDKNSDADVEESNYGNDTFHSDKDHDIDTETDTDDMDESADISDFEVAEDAVEYSEAA